MLGNFVVIFASFAIVKSARILVVAPIPAASHHIVFRAIIQELVNRSHEVTAITTDRVFPEGVSRGNLIEINIKDMSYALVLNLTQHVSKSKESNFFKMKLATHRFIHIFLEQLKQKSVLKLIEDKKTFDLLIVDSSVPGALIFSHIFKAPLISLSTATAYPGSLEMVGSETHPLLFPTQYHQKIYNLTILEKIWQLYIEVAYKYMFRKSDSDNDRELKRFFGKDTPPLDKLKNNCHLLFLNAHPIWVHNQAVSPNVVYIWGVHKPPETLLPEELSSYLESSKHGVIYVSFGSIFKTSGIPPETVATFVKVFSRLPYNILLKWDADELPGISENIKISKWFPQSDILKHPNLKLFITHGGLLSTDEAINAGVPLIGIPQFADQHYNTEKYVYFKIGVKLDYKSITIENLEKAINTVLTEYNSYKKNIIQLRTLMHDQQTSALERAIWRVEHALRHGGAAHLRAPAANMSWAQYYELDIVITLLIVFIVLGTLLLVILHTCLLSMLRFVTYKISQPEESAKYK